MSTHIIGVYEEISKIISELSSNMMHLICFSDRLYSDFCLPKSPTDPHLVNVFLVTGAAGVSFSESRRFALLAWLRAGCEIDLKKHQNQT